MTKWAKVKWTEARQIAEAMAEPEEKWPAEGVDPRAHYLALREKGENEKALYYLGHALPRYEAVAWAGYLLQARSGKAKLKRQNRQALDRALRWIDEPSDEFRRAAYAATESATDDSPERFLGLAVYLSGGSLAPPEFPAVNAPPSSCAQLASTSILLAAHGGKDAKKAVEAALDIGDKVAAQGVKALSGK